MRIGPENLEEIRRKLRKSKRLSSFDNFRRWYFYGYLAAGREALESHNMAYDAALKMFPDWRDEKSKNKPTYREPDAMDIKEQACRAGILIGDLKNSVHQADYKAICERLKFTDDSFKPQEPRQDFFDKTELMQPDVEMPDNAMLSELIDMPAASLVDDIMWVMANLEIDGVELRDARSRIAWTLFKWAKDHKEEFFKVFVQRVLPSKQELDRMLSHKDRGEASLDFIQRLESIAQECNLRAV